jgi:hypothetical protein
MFIFFSDKQNNMSDNPIIDWYTKDQRLCDLLVTIDQQKLSEKAAARKAFYEVADLYNLPKFPEDVQEDDRIDSFGEECKNVSVYEQLAIVKWMHPENTLRANVLLAALYVYKRFYSEIEEAAAEYYGTSDDIPKTCYACFYGKDVDVKVRFCKPNKLEANSAARLIQVITIEDA